MYINNSYLDIDRVDFVELRLPPDRTIHGYDVQEGKVSAAAPSYLSLLLYRT